MDRILLTEDTMTTDQRACFDLLCRVFRGKHHAPKRVYAHGHGILCSVDPRDGMSTFDSDLLTRLVVFAHDTCIRVELASSGPRMIGIILHQRHQRDGSMFYRHPTIEEAIETARGGS